MDLTASTRLAADPARVSEAVADLGTYPRWLGIVLAADPSPSRPGDPGPAWVVDLGARLGPLRRSKRVRMVRTVHEPGRRARFERHEGDGMAHSPWVLAAELGGDGVLTMHLHYGGARWLPGLDLLLKEEARRAGSRLDAYLRYDE